jgi:hypothetical protein
VPGASLFLKLLTAHLVGDYLFQSSRLAREKIRPGVLALHAAVHAGLLVLVGLTEARLPSVWVGLGWVLVAHTAIDAWTSRLEPRDLRLLALDQSLHLASLLGAVAIAGLRPASVSFAPILEALGSRGAWLVVCGGLIAVPAGATVVGRWVRPFQEALSDESRDQRTGLERAGRWIGMLERLLIYAAVLGRLESLIGFVVAIKAVLRLPEARERWSRELAEYYLVGSLASLAWALLTAFAVRGLLG